MTLAMTILAWLIAGAAILAADFLFGMAVGIGIGRVNPSDETPVRLPADHDAESAARIGMTWWC